MAHFIGGSGRKPLRIQRLASWVPERIATSLTLDSKLMIGSDGVKPGYTRVTPTHIKDKDMNLVGRAFWNTKVAEVAVTTDATSTATEDVYQVEIRKPTVNLRDAKLDHLAPTDRMDIKKLDKINFLLLRQGSCYPTETQEF